MQQQQQQRTFIHSFIYLYLPPNYNATLAAQVHNVSMAVLKKFVKMSNAQMQCAIDEPSCRRLRLNISQYGHCSNKYITSAGIKVVYRRFGTSRPGCVLCD